MVKWIKNIIFNMRRNRDKICKCDSIQRCISIMDGIWLCEGCGQEVRDILGIEPWMIT